MRKPVHHLWPWILGSTLGVLAAALYLAVPAADATGDDAVVFEVDLSSELTRQDIDDLREFAQKNEGRDIILQPAEGFVVRPGQERRRADQLRAAREDRELRRHVEEGLASGLYVTGDEEKAACASLAKARLDVPGRQLLCDGTVVAAAPRLPYERAKSRAGIEGLLEAQVYDLLEGVSPEEEALGFFSYFSNPAALQSLELSPRGEVVVDFNGNVAEQVGHLHTGYATHTMLQQIFRTLFQFRDVTSVRVTLDGSCDAFGNLIGGPCQDVSRDLFEQMTNENGESLEFFTLQGGQ